MINKKVLPNLYINLPNKTEKLFTMKNLYSSLLATYNQLLVFRLQGIILHKIRFLICLFKLSSVTLSSAITGTIFYSSVKLRHSDTPKVALALEQPYIT